MTSNEMLVYSAGCAALGEQSSIKLAGLEGRLVQLLLDHDARNQDSVGRTPLLQAVEQGARWQ